MQNTFSFIFIISLCLSLIACNEKAAKEQPLPEVFVITAAEQPYKPGRDFNARIESRSDVNIQAQVSGKLIKIYFREGDQVKKGAPLFDIEPSPFKAVLARTQADLTKAKANKQNATKNFSRGNELVKDGFISESEYDKLEARKLEAEAQVEAAIAAVESAQVDLEYTHIVAPQDGRVGRSKPAIGDIVSPQSGELTTLVGQNDMDIVFQVPERLLLAARHNDSKVKPKDIIVAVGLSDGSEYSQTGTIDYFSNRVDPTTGTIEARARIPNPDDFLRPGMFVRALLQLKKPLMGLMVPQAAIQVDQRGKYILAVDDKNRVTRKNLITSERVGENVIVDSGLEVGDRVIMRGIQKVRPGNTAIVKDYKPATEEPVTEAPAANSTEGNSSDQ